MSAAVKFKSTNIARQLGEVARLKVIQGPDYGSLYIINSSRVTIGRGEDNDMVISDLKSSRKHAEFSFTAGRGWSVKDLGSANGLDINGKAARAGDIRSGDTITVGETTFEFITADAGTSVLSSPAKSMSEAKANQVALSAQKSRVRAMGAIGGSPLPAGAAPKKSKLPLPVLLGGVGVLAFLLFGLDNNPAKPVTSRSGSVQNPDDPKRDLASQPLPVNGSALSPAERTAERFFKEGFREFNAGNYLRAKVQFENVLQIAPAHSLAHLYLQNCDRSIEAEVEFHQSNGRKSLEAGKLKEAKNHFQSIVRLLYRDPNNPALGDARIQLDKIAKESQTGGAS